MLQMIVVLFFHFFDPNRSCICFRNYLRVITFVKHNGRISFREQSLIRDILQSRGEQILSLSLSSFFFFWLVSPVSFPASKLLTATSYSMCDLHPFCRMQNLAKELGVVIPVSFFEEANNAHYNSIAIIDADGTDIGVYRKSHIPDGPGALNLYYSKNLCLTSFACNKSYISSGYQEKYYFNPGDTGFKVSVNPFILETRCLSFSSVLFTDHFPQLLKRF